MASSKEPVKPVYALAGKNLYLRRESLERILAAVRQETGEAAQVTTVEGKRAELAEVLDEVRTYSMFSQRRVVVVDEAEALITRHRDGLERYVQSPSDTGTLILLCDSLPKGTRLYKALAAADAVVECEPLKTFAVPGWIIRLARDRYGKKLGQQAAEMIRDLVGDDQGIIDMELAKLATYVGARAEVSATDVDQLVGECREENVFALLDAMNDGDTKTALERWHQVIATDPAAKERAVGGLAWGVRRLMEAHRAYARGESIGVLARKMWTDAGRLEHRLRRTSPRQLEERMCDLLAVDLAGKSGGGTIASAVEKWIIKHTLRSAAADGRPLQSAKS